MSWHSQRFQFFVAAYVVALIALAGIGYFFTDFTIRAERHEATREQRFRSDITYVNLPRMNVTLPSVDSHQNNHLRLDIALEVEKQYAGRVEDMGPRITDRIASYISKQDLDKLSEPRATLWLREKLLDEVISASAPLPVIDLIFERFVIL